MSMKLDNDYLDIERLAARYEPLMKSIYKHFASYNNLFYSQDDYDDLWAQINLEFVKLCREYNPTKGVDFPGYLKIHLQQRVYHHITKLQRTKQREKTADTHTYDWDEEESFNLEAIADLASEYAFDKVEALDALDLSIFTDKRHKFLIESVLFEEKSLEEIAADSGVPLREIKTRFNAACNKLIQHYETCQRISEEKLERRHSPFIKDVKRKPIFITKE